MNENINPWAQSNVLKVKDLIEWLERYDSPDAELKIAVYLHATRNVTNQIGMVKRYCCDKEWIELTARLDNYNDTFKGIADEPSHSTSEDCMGSC